MSKRKLIRSDRFPYHVTARANNREPFPLALSHVWKIAIEELQVSQSLHDAEIQAFVLMPNHFHLLITTPSFDLGQIMQSFMSSFTRRLNILSGRSGRIFGAPYRPSLIESTFYYGHALKYVYRNPVKAGLCSRIEEYEFSTGGGLFGRHPSPIPLHFTKVGFETNLPDLGQTQSWLEWLNEPFPQELEQLIQKSIKRRVTKDLLSPSSRRPYQQLRERI